MEMEDRFSSNPTGGNPVSYVSFSSDEDIAIDSEPKPYLRLPYNASSNDWFNCLRYAWNLKPPSIILSIFSTTNTRKRWHDQHQKERFQMGLVKAANTTPVWILTNGMDRGIANLIGDAIRQEKLKRETSYMHNVYVQEGIRRHQRLPKLIVIGIANTTLIDYEDALAGDNSKYPQRGPTVMVKNGDKRLVGDKGELNPYHTHFLLVDDTTPDKSGMTIFQVRVHRRMSCPGGYSRQNSRPSESEQGAGRSDDVLLNMETEEENARCMTAEVPVIGIVMQGDAAVVDLALVHLKMQLPVIVMKGTGMLADLLAFAFTELTERSDNEYLQSYIKPELSRRILHTFLEQCANNDIAMRQIRDRIIECVKVAKKGGRSCMTVIDINSASCDLADLPKYILYALFKSQYRLSRLEPEQLHTNLRLTLDWNCPDMAVSHIFQKLGGGKIKINKELFELALLRKDREDFIELFLDHGFKIHKYLSHRKLELLFEKGEDQGFFLNVCCGSILGYHVESLKDSQATINYMLNCLTGLNYKVEYHELSMNVSGVETLEQSADSAEMKARTVLIMWAVLFNRPKLAKVLWKRSEEPLVLALVLHRMYNMYAKFYVEPHLVSEMKAIAAGFQDLAVGILDISWIESPHRTLRMLSAERKYWENYSVIQVAYISVARKFIGHPCCQSWLTGIYMGEIEVKNLKWGPFALPQPLKVWTSAFLILPMYVWINFNTRESKETRRAVQQTDLDEADGEDEGEYTAEIEDDKTGPSDRLNNLEIDGINMSHTLFHFMDKLKRSEQRLPLWRKVYKLWSAPVTKFWTFQTFYVFYLLLFSYAVILPTCGDLYIDVAVWGWTLTILMEIIRRTYLQYKLYRILPLFLKSVEIVCVIVFLIAFLLLRILSDEIGFHYPFSAKVVMCLGLMYFYMRMIVTYLPISQTLGPMLVRIRRMVYVDFLDFMRVFLIFMAGGAVVMHAVIYPDFPINEELFRSAFHRAWFSLFITPVSELEGRQQCTRTESYGPDRCVQGLFTDHTCPHTGVMSYAVVITYLIICKMILVTLLFALFSSTNQKIQPIADEIWLYQRYSLVIDFSNRLRLPPPFTVISYVLMTLEFIYRKLCCTCRAADIPHGMQELQRREALSYSYWKMCAHRCWLKKDEAGSKMVASTNKDASNAVLEELLEMHKTSLRRVKDRLVEIERAVFNGRMHVENIHHLLEQKGVAGIVGKRGFDVHVLARQSPYPFTDLPKYPVLDKYVPWTSEYSLYDPVIFSQPASAYSDELRSLVDPDIIEEQEVKHNRAVEVDAIVEQENSDSDSDSCSLVVADSARSFAWNAIESVSVNGRRVTVDRQSWIVSADGSRCVYEVDVMGLPRNPWGRTGVRGRGVLCFWGPNHRVDMVITRFKRREGTRDFVYMDGKKMLMCLLIREGGNLCLPGGYVHGLESRYTVIMRSFMEKVLGEGVDSSRDDSAQDMIQFFNRYASASTRVRARHLYTGYLDAVRNTDNAWIESECWHFHYDHADVIDSKLPKESSTVEWKPVSPDMQLPASLVALIQQAHDTLDSNN
ncbi:PREDICTED: transient receptor potential cation channel subfamily M member 3-like [Priapulus caudatus]|uniref:Transient receptor potential cation channel subfamily M member 3-like n=1 Tax=Priapulus caudatus TaxID=37621 RepID=A0ABM1EDK7_PRICU|nr:PREDICTED: transient receptor potential cation channel subfamily M member 3-like [Priapulus caudatus]